MNQKEMELRIKNLEENMSTLASKQYARTVDNEDKIQKTDSELSDTNSNVSANKQSVNENSDGIFDLADLSDENSASILDLAEYISQLEERVAQLEGGNE